ncbi:MAG: SMI1/KNR4 family protein [Exiguobacterium acetylicum]|jgi:cell wall assembly regulator SMI1
MSSAEFKNVMNRATVAGPASDEMIDDAESKLSLQFPSEYRAFLKEYGAAMRTGFEIAGIFADDDDGAPMWRQIVQATQRLRKSVNGMLPESLIPISDDGCGVAYYIDASKCNEDGCDVIAYGSGIDGKTVAGSLEEFVLKVARDELNV